MDKEEVRSILDLSSIEGDYITHEGSNVLMLSLLEVKLIEKILQLEARIVELEKT